MLARDYHALEAGAAPLNQEENGTENLTLAEILT